MNMTKKRFRGKFNISFRVSDETYKKIVAFLSKIREENDVSRSEFYRVVFTKGLELLEKEIIRNKKYYCDKCGKRLAITIPRHLRSRLDVCRCGEVKK